MLTIAGRHQEEIIAFAQELVRIKSYSGDEQGVIRAVERKMRALAYDEVVIDSLGNVLGRIGNGPVSILFDSHADTVEVNDEEEWEHDAFGGLLIDGFLHGRGSVDMKSSIAASVYAAAIARDYGLISGKTVYVSCTVFEEDCDGENLKHLFHDLKLRPDYVVICEPSNNKIAIGHKGKAQVLIRTQGVSAHGSAPEKGLNAIYEMSAIIDRANKVNEELSSREGMRPTLVMSKISSTSASLNAVPSACEAYIDRRMVPGETFQSIRDEMDALVQGKNASWEIGTLLRKSWTGKDIRYETFHEAWQISKDHPLTLALIQSYRTAFEGTPPEFDFWDFSTNAVTPVSMKIPTIGFGPGDYKLAHMRNERCAVHQIADACLFYIHVIGNI